MLLWPSEAVQGDQALASIQILIPPSSQKRHGCQVCVHQSQLLCVGVEVWEYLFSHPSKDFFLLYMGLCSLCCSEFSEPVDMLTSCSVPAPPKSPELLQAGVTWLRLQWNRPDSSPKEDDIGYVLEMEEEGSVRTQHAYRLFTIYTHGHHSSHAYFDRRKSAS